MLCTFYIIIMYQTVIAEIYLHVSCRFHHKTELSKTLVTGKFLKNITRILIAIDFVFFKCIVVLRKKAAADAASRNCAFSAAGGGVVAVYSSLIFILSDRLETAFARYVAKRWIYYLCAYIYVAGNY